MVSRSAFSFLFPHFSCTCQEHRGKASSCSPTPELLSLLLGVMLLSGKGGKVPGKEIPYQGQKMLPVRFVDLSNVHFTADAE